MNGQDVVQLISATDDQLDELLAAAKAFPGLVALSAAEIYKIHAKLRQIRGIRHQPSVKVEAPKTDPIVPGKIALPPGGPVKREPRAVSVPGMPEIIKEPFVFDAPARDVASRAEELLNANPTSAMLPPPGFRLETCKNCNDLTFALEAWPPIPPSLCMACMKKIVPAGRKPRRAAFERELALPR